MNDIADTKDPKTSIATDKQEQDDIQLTSALPSGQSAAALEHFKIDTKQHFSFVLFHGFAQCGILNSNHVKPKCPISVQTFP